MKLGIIKAFDDHYRYYENSCKELDIEYLILDIINDDWIKKIKLHKLDGILVRPAWELQERKTIYDEILYIIDKYLKIPIYPTFDECYIYENKRMMSYWLEVHEFPHIKSNVFFTRNEALQFIKNTDFPIVIKGNIGGSGSNVNIIDSKFVAKYITNCIFGWVHPLLSLGLIRFRRKYGIPIPLFGDSQRHYIIIQKYLKIKWEWRIVKIGDSYFAHRKIVKNRFASGTHIKKFGAAPQKLLFLVKQICEEGKFNSMDVDIFETIDNQFYINELQTIIDQPTENLMYIDDKPGRYRFIENKFIFEEGEFNKFKSYKLRVENFIEILKNENTTH